MLASCQFRLATVASLETRYAGSALKFCRDAPCDSLAVVETLVRQQPNIRQHRRRPPCPQTKLLSKQRIVVNQNLLHITGEQDKNTSPIRKEGSPWYARVKIAMPALNMLTIASLHFGDLQDFRDSA
jgi:hypothetical protein